MTHIRTALPLVAFLTASAAAAQDTATPPDCKSDDYLQAGMAHMESHYRSFPEELFTLQLLLREGFQEDAIDPDGKWGPKTEAAVCATFDTYTSIGGSDGDWGIKRASHTPQFTNWVLKAARANLSDGEIEFPD